LFGTGKMSAPVGETNGSQTLDLNQVPRSPPRSPPRDKSPKGSPAKSKSRSRSRSRSRVERRRNKSKSRSPSRGRSPKRARRSRSPKRATSPIPPSRVLGVFGLSSSTTQRDLEEEFDRFGKLDKVDLIIDKRTGRSRCFAFVYFDKEEDSAKAKEACTGMKMHGKYIRIDFSKTHRAHSPTPGKYMGEVYGDRGDHSDRRDRRRDRSYDRYDRYESRDRDRRYSPYSRRSPSRGDRYDSYSYDRYYPSRY